MCGRYGFSVKDAREVYSRFDVVNTLPDFAPHYNISPGTMQPVIISQSPNRITRMFWGLIPHFAQDENYKYKTINARAETVAVKSSFSKPLRFQRCLVPATNFYEWDKSRKPSIPYSFSLKSEPLFAFAGLYDICCDKQTGKEIKSFTIITTQANKTVGAIHPRMPVILQKDDEATWLNPDLTEPEQITSLLHLYPDREMEAHPVSPAINNPRNDSEEVLKPV